MDIFVFSSDNLTNIWAGVGAKRWAVSMKLAKNKGTITKAKKVAIGSVGLLYCSETQEFTTPFLTTTAPDIDNSAKNIWKEEWGLPFGIIPLGTPERRLSKDRIVKEMPSAILPGAKWNQILYVQPHFSFQPSKITSRDWEFIFSNLAL